MDAAWSGPRRSQRPGRPDPRRSRAAVGWLAAVVVVSQVVLTAAIQRPGSRLCDPEYAAKRQRLLARRADHPGHPVHVFLGSSRVFMGVRAGALADYPAAGEPLVVNFGALGAGPILQALTYDRLVRGDTRPDGVTVEFWPPFFMAAGPYREDERIDPNTLNGADLPFVTRYVHDPDRFTGNRRAAVLAPSYYHRFLLLNLTLPRWLSGAKRVDHKWRDDDDWGWQPICNDPRPDQRPGRLAAVHAYYGPCLAAGVADPHAVRAFEDLLDECGRTGTRLAVVWMPESSEFRSWYPHGVEAWADDYFAGLRQHFGATLIDARRWMADGDLYDGFHLTPAGAAAFTERLRREGWQ
ncbi:MAG TPA: hypothetical protein VGF55_04225 [Gemmataceae bacterium]|jgi:hypothetical protein